MKIKNTFNPGRAVSALVTTGRSVVRQAAEYLAAAAIRNAPKDTGYLASTITVISPGDSDIQTVIAEPDYAAYVELGHVAQNGLSVPPNPYMRRSIQETQEHFPSIRASLGIRGDSPPPAEPPVG